MLGSHTDAAHRDLLAELLVHGGVNFSQGFPGVLGGFKEFNFGFSIPGHRHTPELPFILRKAFNDQGFDVQHTQVSRP